MSMKEYWNELNEMYGLSLEFPSEMETEGPRTNEIEYDMAMGHSFDSAMQNTFKEV